MAKRFYIRDSENSPEKEEFEAAKRESEDARSYAAESIATARREMPWMNWMEDALTPPRHNQPERRGS